MMRHNVLTVLTLIGLSVAASTGCERTGVAEQQREGPTSQQAAQAVQEATERALAAQAAANKDSGPARADFEKTREDYRHARAADLIELDKKIADLEAKEKTAKDKAKVQLQTELTTIRAKREAFVRDMYALADATSAAWDEETAKVARDWDALKAAVEKAL